MKITNILQPPRVNFSNFLYSQHQVYQFETQEGNFKTQDGILLDYIFLKAPKSKATIIYNHSYGSGKFEGSYLLNLCLQNQFNLCLYDSRASGTSSGGKVTFGFKEREDLYQMAMIIKKMKCGKILLWGRSIGCNAVLQFLNKVQLEVQFQTFSKVESILDDVIQLNDIMGIVLDSPYTNFKDLLSDNLQSQYPIMSQFFSTPLYYIAKKWMRYEINIDIESNQNIDIMQVSSVPMVVLYSRRDDLIPLKRFLEMKNLVSKNLYESYYKFIEMDKSHSGSRDEIDLQESMNFLRKLLRESHPSLFTTYLQKQNDIKKMINEIDNPQKIDQDLQKKVSISDLMYKSIFSRSTFNYNIQELDQEKRLFQKKPSLRFTQQNQQLQNDFSSLI